MNPPADGTPAVRVRKVASTIAVALAITITLVGCYGGSSTPPAGGAATSGSSGSSSGGLAVNESGFAFDPATLDVKVGDTVTFTNQDSAAHNVRIDGRELGDQAQGASVTWKAERAGTFPYACTIHPTMTGTIVVK